MCTKREAEPAWGLKNALAILSTQLSVSEDVSRRSERLGKALDDPGTCDGVDGYSRSVASEGDPRDSIVSNTWRCELFKRAMKFWKASLHL